MTDTLTPITPMPTPRPTRHECSEEAPATTSQQTLERSVSVSITVGACELSIQDLISLSTGQYLGFQFNPLKQLTLSIQDEPIATARLVSLADGALALEILGTTTTVSAKSENIVTNDDFLVNIDANCGDNIGRSTNI